MTENNTCLPLNYDQIISLVTKSCGEIPGELVVEILCKLPVKPLLRFKTACKPWKLLINSPVFVDKHLHRKNPQLGLYPQTEYCCVLEKLCWSNVGACNGIICFKTYSLKKPLVLVNPSTREFSFLPPLLDRELDYCFCYLSTTQEYKIIAFTEQRWKDRKIDLAILRLGKTKSLRHVKDVTVPGRIVGFTPASSGTCMYWLGVDDGYDIVIWYDAIEERFSKMHVPRYPPSPLLYRSLTAFKDSVIMFFHHRSTPTFFDIWILLDDDGSKDKSWIKYRKIGPLKTGITMIPINVFNDRYVLCGKDGVHVNMALFYYDLETDQVEDYDQDSNMWRFPNYVQSLVPINSLVPCIDTEIESEFELYF